MRGGPPGGDVGGPSGFGPPGFGPPGVGAAGGGQNLEVTYIEGVDDEDIEKKLNGRKLAITIRPQKMVVLQASFPYRAQLGALPPGPPIPEDRGAVHPAR